MRWYGEEAGEIFFQEFHLGGRDVLVADLALDALGSLALLKAGPDGEAVVELVAGELDLLAEIVVLEESDQVARGEPGIVEHFKGALGSEVAGLVVEPGGFPGIRSGGGRGGVLPAAPLEGVGAVEAPDGHAGGFDAVAFAKVGALLPAVAGAGRRVIEEEEEFVEERKGLAVGAPGVPEAVFKRGEPWNTWRSRGRLVLVEVGRRIKIGRNHKAAILRRPEKMR